MDVSSTSQVEEELTTAWLRPPSLLFPPGLLWASGLSEGVMTCPDTTKSLNGILPASPYTLLMRMIVMMMTSEVIQPSSEQTRALIHSFSFPHKGSDGFLRFILSLLGHNFTFPFETVSKIHYRMSKMHNHQAQNKTLSLSCWIIHILEVGGSHSILSTCEWKKAKLWYLLIKQSSTRSLICY